MQHFLFIFLEIVLPIFLLIGIGVVVQRKFQLDLKTLSLLNIYVFVPGIIFVKLYETSFSLHLFLMLLGYFSLFVAILFGMAFLYSALRGHDRRMKTAFSNSIVFYNSGNYGVPINDLVFKSDPLAMSVQIIILTFQNIFTFSYGVIALQSISGFQWKVLLNYFRTPVFLAMCAGILLNVLQIGIPNAIMVPARYVSDGLIAIALITLGAQVASLKITTISWDITASLMMRLVLGPVITWGIILIFRLDGLLAQALLIASAMPTSVNSSIIAQVYNNEPEFAAQVVWLSTLLSAVTVSIVIYCAMQIT